MSKHHVKIHGHGRSYEIAVDGHPVQNVTEALTLHLSAREEIPVLTLRLVHLFAPDAEMQAVVKLDASTREALKAIGWIPPEEED